MNDLSSKAKLLLWLIFVGLMLIYLSINLRLVSDIGQFMPAAHQDIKLQALISEMQNGPSANTLMLRISGASSKQLADISTRLSQKLRTHTNLFKEIRNSNQSIKLNDFNSLFAYRYLLSDKQDWSKAALKKDFEQRLIELRFGAGPMLSDSINSDPQLTFIKYLQNLFDITGPSLKHGVWFDQTEDRALVLVSVNSDALDLDIMQDAVDTIHHIFTSLELTSPAKIEIAGPGVMAVETRSSIERTVTHLSIFMTALLIIVFAFAYRSLYLLLLASLPLLTAIIFALTITQFLFHEVHGIVIAFGITLLGVCLDYPLHLFSHLYKNEQPIISLNKIWPTLLLSSVSSVLAYLALLGSGFNGLSQLAIFAACGLTAALTVTRFLLPTLAITNSINIRLPTIKPELNRFQKTGLTVVLLGLPLIVITQSNNFWETSVDAISPVPISARQNDRELRHELNLPEVSHIFLLSNKNLETVLQASEGINQRLKKLQTLKIIERIWAPSQILPSIKKQKHRQQALPSKQELSKNVNEVLADSPFRPAAFEPWIKDVNTSQNLKPLDYAEILSTPLATILQQGLFQHNGLWISTIRISGIRSEIELNEWLNLNPDIKRNHVQIKQATEHLLAEYRKSTFERFVWAVILLTVIILFWSHSVKKTSQILLPVSIGILSGLALPLLMGNAINIFHLLALLLVLGMGLDYSLFFNRVVGSSVEQQQTLHATSISAATTFFAFSVLAFSSVPVMVSMGQTVASGTLMCFVSAWLLSTSTNNHS